MSSPSEPLVTLVVAKTDGDKMQAFALREIVFIEEQSVPKHLENDEEDSSAFHLLALSKGHAVGTGRLVKLSATPPNEKGVWCRIGRMAVLKSHRKNGVGRLLLEALEQEAKKQKFDGIVLHAQVSARGFYERFGYVVQGEEFDEAGIPHVEMTKRLT